MPQYLHMAPGPVSDLAREARVRMRDGIYLGTDVYLPGAPDAADETPGDTILIRLPYDKSGAYCYIPQVAEYFTKRGYRVVAQDVRGKFRSEGEALLFVHEAEDGYDAVEWIVSQSWSNGRVAMWGDSYYGYTQWAAAASGHPALKAIAPRVTGTGLGEPVHRTLGERTRKVEMGITNLYPLTHFFGNDTYLWEPDWRRRDFAGQAEEFMTMIGERSISYDQWVPQVVPLKRFPNGCPFAGRSLPVLHTVGWWDNCAPLSWTDVAAIAQHPNWDAHHYLRIESIDHENHTLLEPAEDRVADRSAEQIAAMLPAYLDPALEFFEVFVRGNSRPSEIPRVKWNLGGTDEYRTSETWPPAQTRLTTRYADVDGGLSAGRPTEATALSWTHDPEDLVPSSVPDAFSYLLHLPNEGPIGDRDDVLVFTSGAQSTDVDLAGPVTARVRYRSTGPVADCFVRVLDVAPDGTALRIARGQVQLRNATEDESLVIDLGQIGYRLRAGHRLRVHLSASDYPEFLPQPGTGRDPWTEGEETKPNTQTILVGGPDAFAIDIPVLEGTLA
ncbi:CocE/NonD family hydrolase [Arthrobacter sp. ISL-95]|uniref:CocE/NonD family hydrolase n=1 Tax=Arthrobacter sp. ISL-95 TaxID=2819116 RepID=UPI001BE61DBC|nr:CocE/NonD family hydrolase [Arthrobacter sp. ISL-95]MBT2588514.1 CocE/NonD family hydrolase [Arthrobacter sp. ISL-95]